MTWGLTGDVGKEEKGEGPRPNLTKRGSCVINQNIQYLSLSKKIR